MFLNACTFSNYLSGKGNASVLNILSLIIKFIGYFCVCSYSPITASNLSLYQWYWIGISVWRVGLCLSNCTHSVTGVKIFFTLISSVWKCLPLWGVFLTTCYSKTKSILKSSFSSSPLITNILYFVKRETDKWVTPGTICFLCFEKCSTNFLLYLWGKMNMKSVEH